MAKLQTAGKWFGNCIARNTDAAGMTGSSVDQFVITGGPIRVISIGILVRTTIPAGANTVKFVYTPEGGSETDLSAAVDTASASQWQFWYATATVGDALAATSAVGMLTAADTGFDVDMAGTVFWLGPGTIAITWSGGAPATGAIQVFMEYRPMSQFTGVALA